MQELVCVTVPMASVGQTVKVSTLREAQGHYVLLHIICGTNTSLNGSCEGFFFHFPNSHFTITNIVFIRGMYRYVKFLNTVFNHFNHTTFRHASITT